MEDENEDTTMTLSKGTLGKLQDAQIKVQAITMERMSYDKIILWMIRKLKLD